MTIEDERSDTQVPGVPDDADAAGDPRHNELETDMTPAEQPERIAAHKAYISDKALGIALREAVARHVADHPVNRAETAQEVQVYEGDAEDDSDMEDYA